jgi:hypothetical protein
LYAAESTTIASVIEDPFYVCSELQKNLPNSISKIRKLGKVLNERSAPDSNYCENFSGQVCTVDHIHLKGLELHLLTRNRTQETTVLIATVSSSKWKLLGDIHVGQKIESIENKFGVKISPNISPVEIVGDCTPLFVWHESGIVTRLRIDCQACI